MSCPEGWLIDEICDNLTKRHWNCYWPFLSNTLSKHKDIDVQIILYAIVYILFDKVLMSLSRNNDKWTYNITHLITHIIYFIYVNVMIMDIHKSAFIKMHINLYITCVCLFRRKQYQNNLIMTFRSFKSFGWRKFS